MVVVVVLPLPQFVVEQVNVVGHAAPVAEPLIREGKTFQIPSLMQVGKNIGMVSLNDALMDLVTRKLVAPGEALGKAVDKPGFEALLKRAGVGAGLDQRLKAAAV